MEVVCRCTSCDTQFKVDEKYAGRKAKCPKCATVVQVPAVAAKQVTEAPPESAEKIEIQVGGSPKPSSAQTAPTPSVPSQITVNVATDVPSTTSAGPIVSIDNSATGSPSVAKTATTTKPAPAKAKQKFAILPIIAGGVLAVIVVGAFYGIVSLFKGNKGQLASGKPVLVIELGSAERKGASVSIDGKKREIPSSGEVKFELKEGEHTIKIHRRGYEPIDETVTLKSGRLPFKPKWHEVTGGLATSGGTSDGTSGAATSSSFGPAGQSGVNGYTGWFQNLEVARRKAGEAKKDLLLVFISSDSSDACQAILREVFTTQGFRQLANARFIPVVIDLPHGSAAYNMLEDRAQNDRLQMQYHVSENDLPALVLIDTQGRPYAMHETYENEQGASYLDKLKKSLDDRAERDRILALPKSAAGDARLAAAKEAAAWLQARKIIGHFSSDVSTWLGYAKEYDPNNEQGSHEVIFEADWLCRLNDMRERGSSDKLKQHVAELEIWQQSHKFKTPDRGARLHLLAAMLLARLNDAAGAARQIELGLACNPQDPKLREGLAAGSAALAQAGQLSSGSGFVVGEDGYILTNHHVIDGPGKVVVRLSDAKKDTIPASVIAKDAPRDMALIKVSLPDGAKLPPVTISIAEMRRGARVAAFGFPLGDAIGQGLKLTQGAIGAPADNTTNKGMMLLDMRVNPGNSGGPLCDARGNVIGLVTAKVGGGDADSYGLARATPDLIDFLKKNLPGYVPPVAEEKKEGLEWDEVDRIMSPSVVMILKMER